MSNYSEVKRKHYRFPAFSDEEGVKMPQKQRSLFSKEPDNFSKDTVIDYQNLFAKTSDLPEMSTENSRTLRRSRKETLEKQGLTINQQEELNKHRQHLPDYSKKIPVETDSIGRTSLFGKEPRTSSLKTGLPKNDSGDSIKKQYSGRSYFVPKYIPASVIPDKKAGEISQEELMASMTKPQDSFLLFDTETTAYDEKKDHQVVDKDSGSFVNEKGEGTKHKSILERGLSGLIADEAEVAKKNSYFQKKIKKD